MNKTKSHQPAVGFEPTLSALLKVSPDGDYVLRRPEVLPTTQRQLMIFATVVRSLYTPMYAACSIITPLSNRLRFNHDSSPTSHHTCTHANIYKAMPYLIANPYWSRTTSPLLLSCVENCIAITAVPYRALLLLSKSF
jgi:hypothetical protein